MAARLGVVHDGVGDDDHPVAGQVGPPAQVDVVAQQRQPGVEAAELVPDVAAHQHPGGADREHRADAVVLALVVLAALQPGLAAAAAGDRDADLEQQPAVAEAAHLGAGHRDPRVAGDLGEQLRQGVGRGRAVVVQQPDPVAGRRRASVEARPATAAPKPVRGGQRRRPRSGAEPVGAAWPASVVPSVGRVAGVGARPRASGGRVWAGERGLQAGQPPVAVMGDHHRGHGDRAVGRPARQRGEGWASACGCQPYGRPADAIA